MAINILLRFETEQESRAVKVIEVLHDHFFGLKDNVIKNGHMYTGDQFVDQYYGRGDQNGN